MRWRVLRFGERQLRTLRHGHRLEATRVALGCDDLEDEPQLVKVLVVSKLPRVCPQVHRTSRATGPPNGSDHPPHAQAMQAVGVEAAFELSVEAEHLHGRRHIYHRGRVPRSDDVRRGNGEPKELVSVLGCETHDAAAIRLGTYGAVGHEPMVLEDIEVADDVPREDHAPWCRA